MIDLATIQAVLNQVYGSLIADQLNQRAVVVGRIPKTIGSGKNIAWDAKLVRGTSAGSYASGADITGDDRDVEVPAVLNWKRLKAEFKVAGDALAAAATSGPQAYVSLLGKAIQDATRNLGVELNKQVYGDGTGNGGQDLDGLGVIVANTGSYAGIYRTGGQTNYDAWKATVLANSGTGRPLTIDLMRTAETAVFKASGFGPDFIVTNPEVYQAYEGLFDNLTRRGVNEPFEFGAASLGFKGIPIIRDPHCPAGTMYMLSRDCLVFEQLPVVTTQNGINLVSGEQPITTSDGNIGLQVAIEMLGRVGDSYKGFVKLYGNLKCEHPNRCAVIKDIA